MQIWRQNCEQRNESLLLLTEISARDLSAKTENHGMTVKLGNLKTGDIIIYKLYSVYTSVTLRYGG
jgi:hypothetical protein